MLRIATILFVLLALSDVKVEIEHNENDVASHSFKFTSIPAPTKDDLGAKATLSLIEGPLDGGSADLNALVDGVVPTNEDDPGSNVYFRAGGMGGRFRMDFGSAIDIEHLISYSWHPASRGPQLYKLYAAEGAEVNLNLAPKRGVDPATVGWKFVTLVNTIPSKGEEGGQYAARVSAPGGLGKYRYLLFDCYVTELSDDWGNTFYSEIDVIQKK